MRPPESKHFSGEKLYGDDFSEEEIVQWFRDEEEAYAKLFIEESKTKHYHGYSYASLNELHGYRHLPKRKYANLLGLGSALGEELLDLAPFTSNFTVLDPSEHFAAKVKDIGGKPVKYIKPKASGKMPFPNDYFDVATCFGVLHHIPNVSSVISECSRCLAPGGCILIREPVVSLGDWRKQRAGLTLHERGIPVELLRKIVEDAGLTIRRQSWCMMPPWIKCLNLLGISPFSNRWSTRIDAILSQVFSFNYKYHREKVLSKFAPAAIFLVAYKRS